jgi:thiamine monophosphate kinase
MDHKKTDALERRIIEMAQRYPGLRHEFGDCGVLDPVAKGIEHIVVPLTKRSHFGASLDLEHTGLFTNAFLSLQINPKEYAPELFEKVLSSFYSSLERNLEKHQVSLCKADTTFLPTGTSYAVVQYAYTERLASISSLQRIGTIDAYVQGRHFDLRDDPFYSGYYAACAAISDIGANGGKATDLEIVLMDYVPNDDYIFPFCEGIQSAADYCGIKKEIQSHTSQVNEANPMAVILTVLGSVPFDRRMSLLGLEEGMNLYIAGFVGGSSAVDYHIEPCHLAQNLHPSFRKALFEKVSHPALCSDVSDGVDTSLKNLLRNATGLSLQVSTSALMRAAYNQRVTLDNIKTGGDDYALVLATHADLQMQNVIKVGEVTKGKKEIIYGS